MGAGFLAALRGEIFIARRSRGTAALLLLPMALAAGRVGLGKLHAMAREAAAAARGLAAGASAGNAYGPLADGLGAGLSIGLLILLALAAASVAGDRDLGTIRIPLTLRASRSGLLLAKLAALCLLGIFLSAAVLGASWAASAILYDFGPVVEDGYEIFPAGEIRREIALGLAGAAVAVPAVAALGLLVSVAARSAAEAVGIALPLVLAFDVFEGLLGRSADLVFLSYPPTLIDRSYLAEAAKLARGFSDAGWTDGRLILNFAVPIPEAALLVLAALWIFGRRKL